MMQNQECQYHSSSTAVPPPAEQYSSVRTYTYCLRENGTAHGPRIYSRCVPGNIRIIPGTMYQVQQYKVQGVRQSLRDGGARFTCTSYCKEGMPCSRYVGVRAGAYITLSRDASTVCPLICNQTCPYVSKHIGMCNCRQCVCAGIIP